MLVVFVLSGPPVQDGVSAGPPANRLSDVLADVVWGADPADGATWPSVGDWARQ